MKYRSIHISIPTPCHESWDSMDATAHGAFCHSCQKEVIDFSAMTDREVIEYLSKNKVSCGRYRNDQLDTKLTISTVSNGFLKWRAFLLTILSFAVFKNVSAKLPFKAPMIQKYESKKSEADQAPGQHADSITVHGKVLNADSSGLPDAIIELLDTAGRPCKILTTTDSAGNFTVMFPESTATNSPLQLWIFGGSYRPKTITMTAEPIQYVTVILNEPEYMKKGMMMRMR